MPDSLSAAPETPRRCLVAIVHNWPVVWRATTQSLMELGWGNRIPEARDKHGFAEVSFGWYTDAPRVDALRDSAAMDALQEGFTHLLFLDADMIWPTDVLDRMLAHHADGIVSGLYTLKAPPYAPVALRDGFTAPGSQVRQFYHDLAAVGTRELREEEVVGMGCTIIPVEVFRQLERPWFTYANDDAGWPRVSEDVPFCLKARAAGFPIRLDPTISCGHVGTQVFDQRWHRRFQTQAADAAAHMTVTVRPEGAHVEHDATRHP